MHKISKLRTSILCASFVAISNHIFFSQKLECEKKNCGDNQNLILDKILLLQHGLISENRRLISESASSDDLKTFSSIIPKAKGIIKIGQIIIDKPVEVVAQTWENHVKRKEWDKKICSNSEVISCKLNGQPTQPIYHLVLNSIFPIPSRDFAFTLHRSPGIIVGNSDFQSLVLVNLDASHLIPGSWIMSIRGSLNSILYLEPLGTQKTRVTYVVQLDPGGMLSIFPYLASLTIGNNLLSSLTNLKRHLEIDSTNINDDSNLSIEEAAKKIFEGQLEKKLGKKRPEDIFDNISKEDLKETIRISERRLADIKHVEKAEGMDMSDLRHRIEEDIHKMKDRIKRM